jgi:AmmeMemoRadiSam system protein B
MKRAGDRVRPPECAGRFYPAEPARLAETVDRLLAEVPSPPADDDPPIALVAPHAGYVYSGRVAAAAYRRLAESRGLIRRVLVLGPAHFAPFRNATLPECSAFATPLGEVRVDRSACALAATLPAVTASATAHRGEHSIEVQLPFVQRSLGSDISIVPVVVGPVETSLVANLIDALWTDGSTAVVVSTDLSHYYDQATAQRLDACTAQAILDQDSCTIADRAACGRYPLRGLLDVTRKRSLDMRQLDLRTSAAATGDRSRVVGYGAFAAYSAQPTRLAEGVTEPGD